MDNNNEKTAIEKLQEENKKLNKKINELQKDLKKATKISSMFSVFKKTVINNIDEFFHREKKIKALENKIAENNKLISKLEEENDRINATLVAQDSLSKEHCFDEDSNNTNSQTTSNDDLTIENYQEFKIPTTRDEALNTFFNNKVDLVLAAKQLQDIEYRTKDILNQNKQHVLSNSESNEDDENYTSNIDNTNDNDFPNTEAIKNDKEKMGEEKSSNNINDSNDNSTNFKNPSNESLNSNQNSANISNKQDSENGNKDILDNKTTSSNDILNDSTKTLPKKSKIQEEKNKSEQIVRKDNNGKTKNIIDKRYSKQLASAPVKPSEYIKQENKTNSNKNQENNQTNDFNQEIFLSFDDFTESQSDTGKKTSKETASKNKTTSQNNNNKEIKDKQQNNPKENKNKKQTNKNENSEQSSNIKTAELNLNDKTENKNKINTDTNDINDINDTNNNTIDSNNDNSIPSDINKNDTNKKNKEVVNSQSKKNTQNNKKNNNVTKITNKDMEFITKELSKEIIISSDIDIGFGEMQNNVLDDEDYLNEIPSIEFDDEGIDDEDWDDSGII